MSFSSYSSYNNNNATRLYVIYSGASFHADRIKCILEGGGIQAVLGRMKPREDEALRRSGGTCWQRSSGQAG
jgi:hypothetical protein